MNKLRAQRVVLDIVYDASTEDPPVHWDWPEMLDLPLASHVVVRFDESKLIDEREVLKDAAAMLEP